MLEKFRKKIEDYLNNFEDNLTPKLNESLDKLDDFIDEMKNKDEVIVKNLDSNDITKEILSNATGLSSSEIDKIINKDKS